MRIALVQPNLDEKHENQKQAYGSAERPPETGLAVLDSWIKKYSSQQHSIIVLNPNKAIEKLAEEAAKFDFLGISDWFSNHDNCIFLAKKVKEANQKILVALGGPNASMIPKEILNNNYCVDFVVSRDGEDAFLGLVDGKAIKEIPNLWHRLKEKPLFTFQKYTDLQKLPLWDFSDFRDLEQRLSAYLKIQNSQQDPWLVSPIAIFSVRGCIKALTEGICSYCSSSETKIRLLPAQKFWKQIKVLNDKYGAEYFYVCDDIFPISPKWIKEIAEAKPQEAKARIRAYGYLPILAALKQSQLEETAKNLKKIGVFNLFFGSENFDEKVLAQMNKKGIRVEETTRVIETIGKEGIKTTIAFLLGLPGESKQSLEKNLKSLEKLLEADDFIERLYISIGMPLKGTPWCKQLETNQKLTKDYKKETGKDLKTDDSPNYKELSRLSIKYTTSTTPQEINEYLDKMINCARKKMPDYRIGGFLLEIK